MFHSRSESRLIYVSLRSGTIQSLSISNHWANSDRHIHIWGRFGEKLVLLDSDLKCSLSSLLIFVNNHAFLFTIQKRDSLRFKKPLTISRAVTKRDNLKAAKVENLYFFRKCKSNPKIVETGSSVFLPQILSRLFLSNLRDSQHESADRRL
jgi:hypothetical protein